MADKNRRPRVTLGLDEHVKEEIETWASREHRSLANQAEHMVMESYERRKAGEKQLILNTEDEATKFLKKLGTGKRPTSIERAALADSLEIDVEILDKLVDCIFQTKHGVNHGS